MTLEEVLKFTYCWCQNLDQSHLTHEVGLACGTGAYWDSFCREVCEIAMFENSAKIDGEVRVVQIDESKSGKRKYTVDIALKGSGCLAALKTTVRDLF